MSVEEAVLTRDDEATPAVTQRTWAYYPGCSLESSSRDFDLSSRAVLTALGADLVELPGWACCGGSSAHQVDHTLGVALPARNLRLTEELGLDIVMPCPACSARHLAANAELADPVKAERINAVLDEPAAGSARVLNILDALDEVTRDLSDGAFRTRVELKVVPYYGCLLTRPGGGVAYDDPEDPETMDRLPKLAARLCSPGASRPSAAGRRCRSSRRTLCSSTPPSCSTWPCRRARRPSSRPAPCATRTSTCARRSSRSVRVRGSACPSTT